MTVYLLQSKRHPFIIERDASALDVDVAVERPRKRRPFPDEPRVGADADRARALEASIERCSACAYAPFDESRLNVYPPPRASG